MLSNYTTKVFSAPEGIQTHILIQLPISGFEDQGDTGALKQYVKEQIFIGQEGGVRTHGRHNPGAVTGFQDQHLQPTRSPPVKNKKPHSFEWGFRLI